MTKVNTEDVYDEPLSWPIVEQLRYVRGFADGEGGPRLYYHRAVNSSKRYANLRMVVISNTDLPLLNTIRTILAHVSIESTIYLDHRPGQKQTRKDSYVLVIMRGQSLELFHKLVGFTNPAKSEKMLRIVRSYKRYAKTVKSAFPGRFT